jgi:exopolysaccharide/PEP-CTERM locus tyrosine autokinase
VSKIEKALEKAKQVRQTDLELTPDTAPQETSSLRDQEPIHPATEAISLDRKCLAENRLMTLLDDPEVLDYYNLLRTQVLWKTRTKNHNTIMITSAMDGEGKTITAINLAASIAREVKHTCLLVDTDLRNPKVHHYLGCGVRKGLVDHLLNDASISELLINPDGSGKMVVLPAGKPLYGSTELLGSPKMQALVEEMKSRYQERFVIFDSPPILAVPDALVFSAYVDAVILVVEAGKTSSQQILKAIELLEGRNILGLVMNKANQSDLKYGYYRYYGPQLDSPHPSSRRA